MKVGAQIANRGNKKEIAQELLDMGIMLNVIVGGQNTLTVGQVFTRKDQAKYASLATREQKSPEHGVVLCKVAEMPPDFANHEF